jgi:sigma-B regulation protein RsbU (phosphoserine phosphatase)
MRAMDDKAGLSQAMGSNDTAVDKVVISVCAALSVIMLLMYVYMRSTAEADLNEHFGHYVLLDEVLLLSAVVVYCTAKEGSPWPRFLYIGVIMFTALVISSVLSLSYLVFVIPILLVTSYYNKRFTLSIAVLGAALLCLEPFISSYMGIEDLNYCDLKADNFGVIVITSTPMEEAMYKFVGLTLPTLLIYAAVTVLSMWVTTTGLSMMRERTTLAESRASLENELSIASSIQNGMLPTDFPRTESYSIDAVMRPAKDVGGDFYDFMSIGPSQVAFLVADVSGKGVPAALFMASAMTLIRSNLENGYTVDTVLDRTNAELLKANKEKLFVTVWLGVLDLSTGELSYVNAGHNPPFLIRKDGAVENIVSKPNFILGRRKGIRYREYRMKLDPGDSILLYTDGLTDSTDAEGRMFTQERVMEHLSQNRDPDNIIPDMMGAIDRFSSGAEQFDDMTMLLMHYKMPKVIEYSAWEEFPAGHKGHDEALSYIRSRLLDGGCSEKVVKDMELSSSEIIANISMHAYQDREDEKIGVSADVIDRMAVVRFRDDGPEYNPLERSNPDAEKRIKEHKIGGFGIFIVRKLMDDVRYERVDDTNVLTIMKEI